MLILSGDGAFDPVVLAQQFGAHPDKRRNKCLVPPLFVTGSVENCLLEIGVEAQVQVDEVTTALAAVLS